MKGKKKIAVLTGAGVSAESGISTFRDNGGLWDRYDPQVVASIDGWRADRGLLLDFYNMERRHLKDAQPNAAHRAIADLEKDYLELSDFEVKIENTGDAGLETAIAEDFDLIILDLMLPGMDGFETLEEIRKENSLPILMFTSKNDSISKVRGLRAGADDYLTKPFDMDELIARIVSLIRRYTRFNQQAGTTQKLDFDGLQIDLENRSVTTANGTFELPPKEFDLLLYCAKHQGKILTKQQIYEEVWGEEYFYDDSNIMAIISRLRKKLEVNPSSPKYIQTVKGIGYRFNKEV